METLTLRDPDDEIPPIPTDTKSENLSHKEHSEGSKDSIEEESSRKEDENHIQLEELQCPFTWGMDDLRPSPHIIVKLQDDEEDYFPIIQLMKLTTSIFMQSKAGEASAIRHFKRCNEIFKTISER